MVLCLILPVCCVGCHRAQFYEKIKLCLYLLSLSTYIIPRHHNIGYHINADDPQLNISFKCKDPMESLTKLNMYISDIRVWMIKNNLEINNSKK